MDKTSRFITDPDIVDAEGNIVVLLIDPDISDIEQIGLFCKVCNKNYDIYLCNGLTSDLDWAITVANNADLILKAVSSQVELEYTSVEFDTGAALKYLQTYDET